MTTKKDSTEAQAVPKIHSAMIAIMRQCGGIKKGRQTTGIVYNFRGIDDVMNELHSNFAENGVFILPEVLETERREYVKERGGTTFYERIKVRFTFMADDGSSVSAIAAGEGMDSGDKASNKAMSAALKYCLLQTFLIPTEEKKDSEYEDHKVTGRAEIKPEPKKEDPKYTMDEALSAIRMASTRQELVIIYNSVPHLHGYTELVTALSTRKAELTA